MQRASKVQVRIVFFTDIINFMNWLKIKSDLKLLSRFS